MKRKLFFLTLEIIVVSALLIGLLLVWAAFQSFETLASLLNRLASDGKLEAFNISLYQTLKTPLALTGTGLVVLAGLILFRWDRTKQWLQEFPGKTRDFFSLLRQDRQNFLDDARNAFKNLGRGGAAILVGLMMVALVIRLGNLDLPLGHDEAYMYNAFASRSFWHIISDYHLPNNHVLLSIIMKIVTGLLGNHVWALRLPTIIAGVFMVPATYFFAKGFYSKESAILSSILVTVFPILVQYSVLARGYVIIGLITVMLFTLGDYVRLQKNCFAWLLIVLLSALGFYTIPIMLFPFGALYIWLFVSWALDDTRSYAPKSTFLKYWVGSGISAALITIVLYTPIITNSFDRFFGNSIIAPLEWDIFPITTWTRLRNTWADWTTSIPIWIVLIGVLGLLVSLIFHRRFSGQRFSPQLAFIIWIAILLFLRRPDMLPRFWLFLAAPVLTWAAAGIVELLKMANVRVGKKWSLAQTFVGLVFALVVIQGLVVLPTIPSKWSSKDGMANATIYLKNNIRQGDLVTATPARLPALRYYFNYYGIPKGYIRQTGQFQRAFIIVDGTKVETLDTIAPQLGFDVPAIDMNTIEIVYQHEDFTIYECYPVP